MCSTAGASMPAGAIFTAMLRAPKGSTSNPFLASSSEISVKTACCAGGEFNHQRQQQTLAFDFLGRSLFQDLLEQNPFVGHVLIDNPEAFGIYREDKGIANLTKGCKRGQGRRYIARWLRFVGDRRSAAVIDRGHRFGSANQR